jgi:AraC family L-rhamnose operon regulatory protein RhaS
MIVLESRHAPDWSGPKWFDEDFNKFLFVASGRVSLHTPETVFHLGRNSLVHTVAYTLHSNVDVPGETVVVYVIHYRPQVLPAGVAAALRRKPIVHWNLTGAAARMGQAVRRDFQEMLYEQVTRREEWEGSLVSILIRLAVRVLRLRDRQMGRGPETNPRVLESLQRVASYAAWLESGFYHQQSLDEAAANAGLSRRQFTDLFRRVTGRSWRQELLRLRLRHAVKLLMETSKSVTEVVFECGFDDMSNFYQQFKAAFGCPPHLYRQRHRPKSLS